jgi:hypothetical protein
VLAFDEPVLLAATYPETIALSSILASPHWRAMAISNHDVNRDRFYEQTAQRLDISSVHPSDSWDPLVGSQRR